MEVLELKKITEVIEKKETLQRDSRVGNTPYLFVFWLICGNQKWAPFLLHSSHHFDQSPEAVSMGRCVPAQSWPGLKPNEMVPPAWALHWCSLPEGEMTAAVSSQGTNP